MHYYVTIDVIGPVQFAYRCRCSPSSMLLDTKYGIMYPCISLFQSGEALRNDVHDIVDAFRVLAQKI